MLVNIKGTNWGELQTANKSLLKLRLKTAESVLLFIFRENPKNRQFWQALADYYQCAAR